MPWLVNRLDPNFDAEVYIYSVLCGAWQDMYAFVSKEWLTEYCLFYDK